MASKLVLRLTGASVVCAFIMGALATAMQYIRVVPLILDAEGFERRRLTNCEVADDPPEPWAPEDGGERGAYTFLSNCLASWSFAMVLLGLYLIDNRQIGPVGGLKRGVAGWTVFMAAPCIGLSPELPGMAAAALTDRQWWWLGALVSSFAGFLLATWTARRPAPLPPESAAHSQGFEALQAASARYYTTQAVLFAIAIAIAGIPHFVGAPHPTAHGSEADGYTTTCEHEHRKLHEHDEGEDAGGPPSEMAAIFAVWCLATAFGYWLLLGCVSATAFDFVMGFQHSLPAEVPGVSLSLESTKPGSTVTSTMSAVAAHETV